MDLSRLIAVETANPVQKFSQKRIWGKLPGKDGMSERTKAVYKRFLSDKGIRSRHFGLEDIGQVHEESRDQAARRFQEVAVETGGRAIARCLKKARMSAEAIDGLIIATCTGYLCPGLTSYVAGTAGLRQDIFTLDLVGLGCGAAVPALRAADQFLRSGEGRNVIVLCVEVCSSAIFWGDEIDLILSNAIFADGAAACLLSGDQDRPGLMPLHFESLLWSHYREDLRFKCRDGRLCNVIGKKVPDLAAEASRELFEKLFVRSRKNFSHYAIHPGGRLVLDRIQTALRLRPQEMAPSRRVLRDYGNMSSPGVLFVLKHILETRNLRDQETVAMFTFGAGFTAFGATLKYLARK